MDNLSEQKRTEIHRLYEDEGAENVEIIKQLDSDGIFFLVKFAHHGVELVSICSFEESEEYAMIYDTTIPKYEFSIVGEWMLVYGELDDVEEDEEPEITEVKEEYEIKSDMEDDYYGKSIDDYSSLLDNVDLGRWIDEHSGELYEH